MATYKQALRESIKYFGNEFSAKIFVDKYSLQNKKGDFLEETPDATHKRIATELARVDAKKFSKPLSYDIIYALLKDFSRIIPQGSPLYGIGNPYSYVSLGNCIVLRQPLDSYGGLCYTDEQLAQASKRRCGCGISLDLLRPTDSPTTNSSRLSTGIMTWMQRYSNTTREVGQGGRRGALMLSLNVHHPDIYRFINAKQDLTNVTGANISVHLTDQFLKSLSRKNGKHKLQWPLDEQFPQIEDSVKAQSIWDTIINAAWASGEPGIQFIDSIRRLSPADCYSDYGFRTITTNPCGEIPLSELDSCRLLLLNLFAYVHNPFTKDAYFDYIEFDKDAQTAQRLADNLIDLELECIDKIIRKIEGDPEPQRIKQHEYEMWLDIKQICAMGRRTGTGITALGDTLAALNIRYDSDEAAKVVDKIYRNLKISAYTSSVNMAKEIGAFGCWSHEREKDNEFLLSIKEDSPGLYENMKIHGRRNIALLTTAPAGSVSTQALLVKGLHGVTSGFEPAPFLKFTRRKKGNPGDKDFRVDFVDDSGDSWMEFQMEHPGLELWRRVTGKTEIGESPYVEANDIDWQHRVEMQAIAQKHIDHSISSTVNLPSDATKEDVANIYLTAWKSGCKGITVYRQGSRSGVIVEDKEKTHKVLERPSTLPCDVYHITVKGQPYFVLVGLVDGHPYEVFAGKNGVLDKKIKTGQIIKKRRRIYKAEFGDDVELSPITAFSTDDEDIVTRLVSTSLRSGIDIAFVVQQLEKAKGDMQSFSKCVARALKKYIPDGTKVEGEQCPNCSSTNLTRLEGCVQCSCGWSRC